MLTFREIYKRREQPYILGVWRINGDVVTTDYAHYWLAVGEEVLDSDGYIDIPNYGQSLEESTRYEIYSTLDGVAMRLEDILRTSFENTCSLSLYSIRKALKIIYKTRKC